MTEIDLETLLERGARRLRLQRALRVGLATFGISLIGATVAVFIVRLFPFSEAAMPGIERAFLQLALGTPLVLTAAVLFFIIFVRGSSPSGEEVALLLDRKAGLREHLTTWRHYRNRAGNDSHSLQKGFLEAQLASTLVAAAALKPSQVLPLRIPDWSRALWLAVLLLCCALLMPPNVSAVRTASMERAALKLAAASRENAPDMDGAPAAARQTPTVHVLPPTELLKFQLASSEAELPADVKAHLLKELQLRIGNVPESELTPEVRDILNALRSPDASEKKTGGEAETKLGSADIKGKPTAEDVARAHESGVAANVPQFRERAYAAVQQQFPDVKTMLERYYQPKP